jgi:copper(I)-binding protein
MSFRLPRQRSAAIAAPVILVAMVALAIGCAAPPAAAPSPTVRDAWVRAAPAGGDSAGYLTITNPGSAADNLLSVDSAAATSTMLHETATDSGGMTGMSMVERIAVGAGATVTLAPGGTHVMLSGLLRPLAPGDKVDLKLTFEHAGTIVVSAVVRPG